jgi:uncharacterized paraquat-inducible protein A
VIKLSAPVVKLPPVALTAPTLCPRCDAPALASGPILSVDSCSRCTLRLRQCGRCHGVAGPFDQYCGFCGFEMTRPGHGALRRAWPLALVAVAVVLALAVYLAAHAPH